MEGLASRGDVWRAGEAAALARYRDAGYRLVARNWRCRLGEIDLIVTRGDVVVFCEVKARRGGAFGSPHEAVGWKKRQKLRTLGEAFLAATGSVPWNIRFDVASVTMDASGHPAVHLFEQAF